MFTVLGSLGFIGSHLVKCLKSKNFDYFAPTRYEDISGIRLGHVIDCTGLSADFRTRPFETVEAHVCHTLKILGQCEFESFLYLSSTRVYGVKDREDLMDSYRIFADEEDVIRCEPLDFNSLYNISKIMGESLCFASGQKFGEAIRVVRLSNVYGYDSKSENFIFTLIRDALHNGKIVLNTTLDSCKDHIGVDDIVKVLPEIAMHGKHKIYNVAKGENTTVGEIVNKLAKLTDCSVEVSEDVKRICYPIISIDRIKEEFAFSPTNLIDDLDGLVEKYKECEKVK